MPHGNASRPHERVSGMGGAEHQDAFPIAIAAYGGSAAVVLC